MNIHQVSVNYLHEQDRILVRINSRDAQEIRLWLTRRLCTGWVPALRATLRDMAAMVSGTEDVTNQTSTSPDQPPQDSPPAWTEEFKKLHSLQNTDFKTPFKSDVKTWPLGTEPLLVTTVRMTVKSKDRLDMAFEESLLARKEQVRGFQVSLEPLLLTGFMHLLEKALDNTQWDHDHAPAALGESLAGSLSSGADHDDFATQHRPKYLH